MITLVPTFGSGTDLSCPEAAHKRLVPVRAREHVMAMMTRFMIVLLSFVESAIRPSA
jgi:hypothetical protein